jgi:hypothetical protein
MDHLFYLRKAIEVSKKSREHGNTPLCLYYLLECPYSLPILFRSFFYL